MTTPVQQAAVDRINTSLETGVFNLVTHGDIKSVTGNDQVVAPRRSRFRNRDDRGR